MGCPSPSSSPPSFSISWITVLWCIWLGCVDHVDGQLSTEGTTVVASTSYGRILGGTRTIQDGKSIYSFINIPYAAAPVGGNRFREPQPLERMMHDLDASKVDGISCLQSDERYVTTQGGSYSHIRQDEDCLYLNIFVPANRGGLTQRFPVVVYLHGGEFRFGGKDYYQPDLLLRKDVVLVVPNYRLGILGFLGTDDNYGPGNMGLRDQMMALTWIQSEIGNFNGDRTAVTLLGHDAGAISANILMFAPKAKGLFHRVISMSGSIFTPWAFEEDAAHQSWLYGRLMGCNTQSRYLIRCLRDYNANELVNTATMNKMWFRPVIDKNVTWDHLLEDYPLNLYTRKDARGTMAQIPHMMGVTRTEGSLEYYLRYNEVTNNRNVRSVQEVITHLINPFLKRWAQPAVYAALIDYHYIQSVNGTNGGTGGQGAITYPNSMSSMAGTGVGTLVGSAYNPSGGPYVSPHVNLNQKYIQIMSDFLYNGPADQALSLHSDLGLDSFFYVFSHEGAKSMGPLQRDAPKDVTRAAYAVTHGDDVFYILPNAYSGADLGPEDRMVSSSYIDCLYTFINPSSSPSSAGCTWKPYSRRQHNTLVFSTYQTPIFRQNGFFNPLDVSFWNGLMDRVMLLTSTPPPYFPYREYTGFQAATWSLLGLILLMAFLVIMLVAYVCRTRSQDKRTMKLLRAKDSEFIERFNDN